MSRKDDIDSEFEALMKGMGVQRKKKSRGPVVLPDSPEKPKSQPSPTTGKQSQQFGAPSRRRTNEPRRTSSSPVDVSMQEWIESVDQLAQKTLETDELRQQVEDAEQQIIALKAQCAELAAALQQSKSQLAAREEALEQSRDIQQQFQNKEMQWKQEEGILREQVDELRSKSVVPTSLVEVMVNRGMVLPEEQRSFLQKMSSTSDLTALLTCDEQRMSRALDSDWLLVGNHVPSVRLLSGQVVRVEPERCELTNGLDLTSISRELITEMLLNGYKTCLVLGVPEKCRGYFRDLLTHESISIVISSHTSEEAKEVPNLSTYDIVLFLDSDSVPPLGLETDQLLICSSHRTIAEALLVVRQRILETV